MQEQIKNLKKELELKDLQVNSKVASIHQDFTSEIALMKNKISEIMMMNTRRTTSNNRIGYSSKSPLRNLRDLSSERNQIISNRNNFNLDN